MYSFTLYASPPPPSTSQKAYIGAMTVAICEYFVEASFLPSIKGLALFRLLGLAGMAFLNFFARALSSTYVGVCACVHTLIHPRVSLCLCLACVRLCLCACTGVCAGSASVCEKAMSIVRHTPRAYPVYCLGSRVYGLGFRLIVRHTARAYPTSCCFSFCCRCCCPLLHPLLTVSLFV